MPDVQGPLYRSNLARIHHEGYAQHAELCAPGILALLGPLRGGRILELGCGSGLLTRRLVDAGHTVFATDASPAMLDLARVTAPGADICRLTMPDDPVPAADAVVSIGHAMSYLPDEASVHRALVAAARALRPGGILAIDLCDLEWGATRVDRPPEVRVTDDWVLTTRFSVPSPDRYLREMTTFVRDAAGNWHRDDETHVQVNVDTARIPELLANEGLTAEVRSSFGTTPDEELPVGLVAIVARRPTPGVNPTRDPGSRVG